MVAKYLEKSHMGTDSGFFAEMGRSTDSGFFLPTSVKTKTNSGPCSGFHILELYFSRYFCYKILNDTFNVWEKSHSTKIYSL